MKRISRLAGGGSEGDQVVGKQVVLDEMECDGDHRARPEGMGMEVVEEQEIGASTIIADPVGRDSGRCVRCGVERCRRHVDLGE